MDRPPLHGAKTLAFWCKLCMGLTIVVSEIIFIDSVIKKLVGQESFVGVKYIPPVIEPQI